MKDYFIRLYACGMEIQQIRFPAKNKREAEKKARVYLKECCADRFEFF